MDASGGCCSSSVGGSCWDFFSNEADGKGRDSWWVVNISLPPPSSLLLAVITPSVTPHLPTAAFSSRQRFVLGLGFWFAASNLLGVGAVRTGLHRFCSSYYSGRMWLREGRRGDTLWACLHRLIYLCARPIFCTSDFCLAAFGDFGLLLKDLEFQLFCMHKENWFAQV